jgi:hypothetical protein
MVEMERIIWRTSKGFVFGNAYSTVLAFKANDETVVQCELDGMSEMTASSPSPNRTPGY